MLSVDSILTGCFVFVDDDVFQMTLKRIDESVFEENDMGVVKKETLLEEVHNDEIDEKKSQEQHDIEKESTFKMLYTDADENEAEKDVDDKKKHAAKKPIPLPRPKK